MCNKTEKTTKNSGITLIALIITVIILLILAGITIGEITGTGFFQRAKEANFKTKIAAIAEEWDLYKTSMEMSGENPKEVYAGEVLKKVIRDEGLEIEEDKVINITNLVKQVGKDEETYVMIHEGELYYVSQSTIKNNKQQVEWCKEIGIKIWDYVPPSKIGVVNGSYENVNGVYMCTPKLTLGFSKDHTRYVYLREGNLVPGNWINRKPEEDWYDYDGVKDDDGKIVKEPTWANLYVESNGIESYYVWIPRYVYKKASNERMDVKFVDINNNYKDAETEEEKKWEDLQKEGYQLPEAFWWDNNSNETQEEGEPIPGYWMSKYQLSDIEEYVLDYDTAAAVTTINVQNIRINTDKIVAKYVFSVNGNEVAKYDCPNPNADQTAEQKKAPDTLIKGLSKGDKVLNVTALDPSGEIIGSMTRVYAVAEVNEPDLTGFDKDTTFYVYWDEDGNEHNEIPIKEKAPDEWYDYTTAWWANIVTRNDGLESYYVWIPRYEYQLDGTSNPQKSIIRFIKGTEKTPTADFKIPEAFWWDNNSNGIREDGEELKGYWMSKYQLTAEESVPRMNAEMTAGSSVIRINDITGSLITAEGANARYEYYIDGERKTDAKGDSATEHYVFTGLEANRTYTINIIARNKTNNAYIGAVTKKIKTNVANEPDLTGFNKTCTYYVVYKEDGSEERVPISEEPPENWYDYSKQQWANIVTTGNSTTSYFVWIPRFEYKILADRGGINTANRRIDVNFISKDTTSATAGYKIPEAFWWDNNSNGTQEAGEQLSGYWMSKYQLK